MPHLRIRDVSHDIIARVRAYARRHRITIPAACVRLLLAGLALAEEDR